MVGDGSAFERVYHRQMYVDLLRAYLVGYGTRRRLAVALGLTEAYVSFLLEPLRVEGHSRPHASWVDAGGRTPHELTELLKYLKTPGPARAVQLAEELCSDAQRRDLLLHHMELARRHRPPPLAGTVPLRPDEVEEVCARLATEHTIALSGLDATATRQTYARVWELASAAAQRIEAASHRYRYVQVLLHLHDAASVLDRNDVGLSAARRALLLLAQGRPRRTDSAIWARFWTNSRLAEAVSLNNLQLAADALVVAQRAEREPGYGDEPEVWQRSFLEQRLTSLARLRRTSIYLAESTADRALTLARDTADEVRVGGKLLDAYLAHGTARSLRQAGRLATDLQAYAQPLTPLRRTILLRTLARHASVIGDRATVAELIGQAVALATSANLSHQLVGMRGY